MLALVVAFATAAIALSQAPVDGAGIAVTVSLCEGQDCRMACREVKVRTMTCYRDKATGRHVMFTCGRNESQQCFSGSGFYDPTCQTPYSRNSLRCGSCTLDKVYSCETAGAVRTSVNCTNCQSCLTEYQQPVGQCERDPGALGEFWSRLNFVLPCSGVLFTTRHYFGDGCRGPYAESAVLSTYCACNSESLSRSITCHGVDPIARGADAVARPLPFALAP